MCHLEDICTNIKLGELSTKILASYHCLPSGTGLGLQSLFSFCFLFITHFFLIYYATFDVFLFVMDRVGFFWVGRGRVFGRCISFYHLINLSFSDSGENGRGCTLSMFSTGSFLCDIDMGFISWCWIDTCIPLISFEFSFYSQNSRIDILWR